MVLNCHWLRSAQTGLNHILNHRLTSEISDLTSWDSLSPVWTRDKNFPDLMALRLRVWEVQFPPHDYSVLSQGCQDDSCLPHNSILGTLRVTASSPALNSEHITTKHLHSFCLCAELKEKLPDKQSLWKKLDFFIWKWTHPEFSSTIPWTQTLSRQSPISLEGRGPLLLPCNSSTPHWGPCSFCQQCNFGTSWHL